MSVSWLERGIARDVTSLRVSTFIAGTAQAPIEASVEELQEGDGAKRLALPDLPANTEIRVRIEGRKSSGEVAYVGELGPLAIGRGETYRAQITMVPRLKSVPISGLKTGRFLHTAVRLRDGRVLITGGFNAPERRASCPMGLAEGSECYDLTARDDAFVFDAASARIVALDASMLRARGGHTATLLADGRVLLAGGAEKALLILEAVEGGFVPRFLPRAASETPFTAQTFELFEPDEEDKDPRDPTRGIFTGQSANPDEPGYLEAPRFMHAAALNPASAAQVLLVGGSTSERASTTVETFDAERVGGPGIAPGNMPRLRIARTLPSALGLGDPQAGWVWILGGGVARENGDLAERWAGNESDAVGVLASATESAFPNMVAGDTTPRPEYAFSRPLTAPLNRGSHGLVAGALGPRCVAGVPVFPSTSLALDAPACSDLSVSRRAFIVSADTGETLPIAQTKAHALGAAAALDDGRAALVGGFSSSSLVTESAVEVIDHREQKAAVDEPVSLERPRALHTSTGLFGDGILSIGGIARDASGLILVEGAELIWL